MAEHDWVVHKIAVFHRDIGDDVSADHCRGFAKPPIFEGPRGGTYRPDVWIENKGLVYEVEPYFTLKNSLPQVKAFCLDPDVKDVIVVACSGSDKGIKRLEGLLERKDVDAFVINWRDLFDEYGITW